MNRIAVVTGANRGIGLEIVAGLAEEGFMVYLTSRDVKKGNDAVTLLNKVH
jgi:NAD(P)-dependent dehydrogenase (short-subunit alcohol dehydrogenase family)